MKNLECLIIYFFVLQCVVNGVYLSNDEVQTDVEKDGTANTDYTNATPLIDNGGLNPDVSSGTDMKPMQVDSLQKVVQSALLPGPAIVSNIDENQISGADTINNASRNIPVADKVATVSSNIEVAQSNVEESPSHVEESPVYVAPAPGNVEAASSNVVTAPSKIEAAPSNVEESPSNVEESPLYVAPAPDNVEAAPSDIEAAPSNVEESPSDVEESPLYVAPAPGNVVGASNNVTTKKNTSATIEIKTGLSTRKTLVDENIKEVGNTAYDATESVKDNDLSSLEEAGNWKMTGNESWWKDGDTNVEGSKEDSRDGEKAKQNEVDEKKVSDFNDFSNDEDSDYDYDDDNEDDEDDYDSDFWDEKDDDYDDDSDNDWYEDDDWLEDENDDWDNLEVPDKKISATTEQAWIGTGTDSEDYEDVDSEEDQYEDDYDIESEEDQYEDDYDFDSEEDEYEDEQSIEAGKVLIGSAHSFDDGLGAFAGAKVSSKGNLSNGSVYTWTLLLTICVVLIGLFIFWNRHKVERYIVSLRHPAPSSKTGVLRGDEEKNLLDNEYA